MSILDNEGHEARCRAAVDRRMFEDMIGGFYTRWGPKDERDRDLFATQLHSIIRQAYRDAQEPLLSSISKSMTTHLDLMAMSPMLKDKAPNR